MLEDSTNYPFGEDLELEPLNDFEDDLVNVVLNENSDHNHEVHNESLKPLNMLIRCSVHTLQLCVEDALKSTSDRKFISKMREVMYLIYENNLKFELILNCIYLYNCGCS